VEWYKMTGFHLLSKSVNKFDLFKFIEDQMVLEKTFADVLRQRNKMGKILSQFIYSVGS
jgi:hypothetical protein